MLEVLSEPSNGREQSYLVELRTSAIALLGSLSNGILRTVFMCSRIWILSRESMVPGIGRSLFSLAV